MIAGTGALAGAGVAYSAGAETLGEYIGYGIAGSIAALGAVGFSMHSVITKGGIGGFVSNLPDNTLRTVRSVTGFRMGSSAVLGTLDYLGVRFTSNPVEMFGYPVFGFGSIEGEVGFSQDAAFFFGIQLPYMNQGGLADRIAHSIHTGHDTMTHTSVWMFSTAVEALRGI